MNTTIEHEQIDLRKVLAEIDNLRADTIRMQAETQKLNAETKWHAFYKVAMWWGSAFAAAAAFIKLFNMFS